MQLMEITTIDVLQVFIPVLISVIIGIIAPIIFIIKKLRKAKYNYYKGIQDRDTELELIREQNKLLRQIANNKGE